MVVVVVVMCYLEGFSISWKSLGGGSGAYMQGASGGYDMPRASHMHMFRQRHRNVPVRSAFGRRTWGLRVRFGLSLTAEDRSIAPVLPAGVVHIRRLDSGEDSRVRLHVLEYCDGGGA